MNFRTRINLLTMLAFLLGFNMAAVAGPPDFVGERGGPLAGETDFGGGGPPAFVDEIRGSDDEEADDDEGDGAGPFGGGGPPGLCGVEGDGPSGRAGRSHVAHVNFFQRDTETGERIEDGPWGRMKYNWVGPVFDFVFNAHELEPGDEHTMTYQPEPTPSPGVICLGNGVVNDEGDLHIANAIELNGNLPAPFDESEDGALLVLVHSEDVNCEDGEMLAFIAEDYLFSDALIEYVDTDLEEEEEEEAEEEG